MKQTPPLLRIEGLRTLCRSMAGDKAAATAFQGLGTGRQCCVASVQPPKCTNTDPSAPRRACPARRKPSGYNDHVHDQSAAVT
jgi:hypothetical protein